MSKPVSVAPQFMAVMSTEGMANRPSINPGDGQNLHWTSDPSVELPVKLGCDKSNINSLPPVTVIERFTQTAKKFGSEPALRVKRNNAWVEWTWTDYLRDCDRFAKACIAAGLPRHAAVSIIGFNSPEWLIANIGAIFAGPVKYPHNT